MKSNLIYLEDDCFYVLDNNENRRKSLHTKVSMKKDEVITKFASHKTLSKPNYLTVQIAEEEHIELEPKILQYTNHSCEPNVFFDTSLFNYIALKNINANEELVFFYPSTEWKMDEAFNCLCGHKNCLKSIKGAAYLSKEILVKYQLSHFIHQMLLKK